VTADVVDADGGEGAAAGVACSSADCLRLRDVAVVVAGVEGVVGGVDVVDDVDGDDRWSRGRCSA
jgi:hypothetical protein